MGYLTIPTRQYQHFTRFVHHSAHGQTDVVVESPVSRDAGSPFAIKDRELHTSFWTHPAVIKLVRTHSLGMIYFDQCMSGAVKL